MLARFAIRFVFVALIPILAVPLRAATFTVTTTFEMPGSLREAIFSANATPGRDTIVFALSTSGPLVIRPWFRLPPITEQVTIDATTQPGYAGMPVVTLDGFHVRPGALLEVLADDVVIDGFAFTEAATALAVRGNRTAIRNCHFFDNTTAILLDGSADSTIFGNRIGLDALGAYPHPNETGIAITGSGNRVGGGGIGEGNVISGNGVGVRIQTAGATGNAVQGNLIGTNASGMEPFWFPQIGIEIDGGSANVVGGDGEARNVLSGNALAIRLTGGATGNVVRGNSIGWGVGEWMSIGNDQAIVLAGAHANVVEGNLIHATRVGAAISLENADGNTIGGIGTGNTIDHTSGGDAVSIVSGTGNTIRGNRTEYSAGLGIDLDPDGVNANDALDADDGPNGLQNHPLLTGGSADGPSARIDGTLDSAPHTTYTIDVYRATYCAQQQSGTHFGSTTATTDGGGHAQFSFVTDQRLLGDPLIATATDPDGNTSEFSPCANVLYADLEIAGPISAILEIGTPVPVTYTIRNDGPMHATNVFFVASLEALDSLTATRGDCFMSSCFIETLAPGESAVMTAMYLATGPVRVPMYATVYARERDPNGGNNWHYVYGYVPAAFVVDSAADELDVFPGDGICADAAGACTLRAALVEANLSPAQDTVHFAIGSGPKTIVLTRGSLYVRDEITIDATTQPGYAGTPLITIDGSSYAYTNGFTIEDGRATLRGLTVSGCYVGVVSSGGAGHVIAENSIVSNASDGIRLSDVSGALIERNTIAFNGSRGIAVYGTGTGNTIRGSSIFANAGLGIDLGGNGPTRNDPLDADSGPNSLQNAPVPSLAQSAGGVTSVQGTLDSAPNASFVVELFVSDECDGFGYGEGRLPAGTIDVTTDGAGHAEFSTSFALAIPSPAVITATATDASGSTSELSACIPVLLNRPPNALCHDVAVAASASCNAAVTAADIDAGSFDPDGDALTMSLSPPGPFPTGTTSVALTVTDPSGATAMCAAQVTVTDEMLPEVSCAGDVEVRLDYGETEAAVAYEAPVATDNCPGTVASCDFAPGSLFPAGTTVVTCTATDAGGSVASCTFRVTLLTAGAAAGRLVAAIETLVAQGALDSGNGTALRSQLEAAARSLETGNRTAAIHQLDAFIAHVEALVRGGQLSNAHGGALIEQATALLSQLN